VGTALAAGWRAWAVPGAGAADEARHKLLAAIPRDATVLINVTAADMPASPDVLALGKRSTPALERCLANNAHESLRGYCADLLGVLGDRSALPTLHVALEDWDGAVRRRVIEALAKIPDGRSLDPLLQAFERKDEAASNRGAILTALGTLGDKRAVKVLRRELETRPAAADEDLRQPAFRALWRSRHVLSRSTLVDIVAGAIGSDNGALVYDAVLRAAELRARDCVKPLLALVEHADENIRNKSIYALGLIGDRRAIAPLLALLPRVRDARRLNNIAFALERIDRPAFYAQIRRMVQHQQAVIRLNATFVLGDVRSIEGVPLIEAAMRDPSNRVRLEAIDALAKVPATPAVAAALGRGVADADAGVRIEALEALARIPPGPANPALPKLLERALADSSPEVQRHAIDLLAALGSEASIPALAPFVARRDSALREPAIYATYALSRGKRAELVYDLFANGDDGSVRRAAIVLGRAGDLRVRPYLLGCLESRGCAPVELEDFLRKDRDPATSGRLLLAWAGPRDADLTDLVGKLRPPGVITLAEAKLDVALARADWVAVRRGIDLVVTLRDETGRPRLAKAMAAPDLWMQLHAAVALARLGDGAAEARLLADLDNLPAGWLPGLARLVAEIEEPAARARLLPELARREAGADYPVALAAAAVRLGWAPDAAFPRFLRALGSSQVLERELAERYLWHRPAAVDGLLRRALAVEKDEHVKDELLKLLEVRGQDRE